MIIFEIQYLPKGIRKYLLVFIDGCLNNISRFNGISKAIPHEPQKSKLSHKYTQRDNYGISFEVKCLSTLT